MRDKKMGELTKKLSLYLCGSFLLVISSHMQRLRFALTCVRLTKDGSYRIKLTMADRVIFQSHLFEFHRHTSVDVVFNLECFWRAPSILV